MSENKPQKEKNFVSAVVYLGTDSADITSFLNAVNGVLCDRFEKYEIICVNDACGEKTVNEVRTFAADKCGAPLTVVNMSVHQGVELCMNAGLDISIGDFVFEFDSTELLYPAEMIFDCYKKSLEGFDIVSVCPRKTKRFSSRLFYRVFNSASKSKYKLQTDVFHLLSRRAINRLHSISPSMPYRKAAYAASGLRLAVLHCDGYPANKSMAGSRLPHALDSLALYTDAAYKFSLIISLIMLGVTVFSALYTVAIVISGINRVDGWVTTMLLMSAGFFGIFLILSIVLKYLSLLVDLIFKQQKYLVESIEKL